MKQETWKLKETKLAMAVTYGRAKRLQLCLRRLQHRDGVRIVALALQTRRRLASVSRTTRTSIDLADLAPAQILKAQAGGYFLTVLNCQCC